jgi:hypothetical protein
MEIMKGKQEVMACLKVGRQGNLMGNVAKISSKYVLLDCVYWD